MIRIVIIGSGPSALFAAKTILESNKMVSVTMLEQGKPIYARFCPANKGKCVHCEVCSVLQGGGGAGLFSDGKLILDLTSGGIAQGVESLTASEKEDMENIILNTLKGFDGTAVLKTKPSEQVAQETKRLFMSENLSIKFYDVFHLGSNSLPSITQSFIDYLIREYSTRFSIHYDSFVYDIIREGTGYVVFTSTIQYPADCVVLAVGKSGASWIKTLTDLNINYTTHQYYFGLRIETSSENIERLLSFSFDPKIKRIDNERKIKIHCMCRNGEILFYRYKGTMNVGGHTPYNENAPRSFESIPNANFNILLSYDKKTIDPDEILGRFRAECGNTVAAQKLDDFMRSRKTKSWGKYAPINQKMVSKANIRKIIESLDEGFYQVFIDFLASLSSICPGIMDKDNIIYAPTIEWDMDSVSVDNNMETDDYNLFAIGDGAGLSQGIVFSAATGILAGREISRRFGQVI